MKLSTSFYFLSCLVLNVPQILLNKASGTILGELRIMLISLKLHYMEVLIWANFRTLTFSDFISSVDFHSAFPALNPQKGNNINIHKGLQTWGRENTDTKQNGSLVKHWRRLIKETVWEERARFWRRWIGSPDFFLGFPSYSTLWCWIHRSRTVGWLSSEELS